MVFSSLTFLGILLPFAILLYIPISRSIKIGNYYLIIISLIFYALGDFKALPVILAMSCINYIFGIYLAKETHNRILMILITAINLSVLIFFKSSSGSIPLGISFFTFQNISYCVDIYRNPDYVEKKFSVYLLYILFFPQLIAGPIVKFRTVKSQFYVRSFNVSSLYEGLFKFSKGLFKKVILAENLSLIADTMFDCHTHLPVFYAWMGAVSYSFQIYYDFSGYSDMAVGLAGMFGFLYPDNFKHPYLSVSISEFFRRWHITLSDFFRDYVYIPLGGNREGKYKTMLNIMIVFMLTGLWHGFGLTFIVWGLANGIIVCVEKVTESKLSKIPVRIKHMVTFILITVLWVLFRSDSLSNAFMYLTSMFSNDFSIYYGTLFYRFVNIKYIVLFILAFFFAGAHLSLSPLLTKIKNNVFIKSFVTLFLYLSSIFSLILNTYKPFIYFKF